MTGSHPVLCNTEGEVVGGAELTPARAADSYLLFSSEVLLPRSTRCYSSHEHCPGALFRPSGTVFVIPLLQYIYMYISYSVILSLCIIGTSRAVIDTLKSEVR
jgi:hypothetical protein